VITHEQEIGQGSNNVSNFTDTITASMLSISGQPVQYIMSFINTINLGKNTFVISNLSLSIDCEPTMYIAKIESVNAENGDTVYITNESYSENYGLSRDYQFGQKPYFYAKAGNGRKIEKVCLRYREGVESTFENDYLVNNGHLNAGYTEFKFMTYKSDNSNLTEIDDYYVWVKIYFAPSYAVYIGQTQAIKVFVGTTEILKMV
jgi:hypothetical protein